VSGNSPEDRRNKFNEWATIGIIGLLGVAFLGVAHFGGEYMDPGARLLIGRLGYAVLFSWLATSGVYLVSRWWKGRS